MTFSDSRISSFLQENFIVQWEAVSPVRLVKFDLGEGRSFSGTVNGEIALYFCDSNGKPFDILPALQSPAVTLKRIKESHAFFTEYVGKISKQAIREDLTSFSSFRTPSLSDEEIDKRIQEAKGKTAPKGQITVISSSPYSPIKPTAIHSSSLAKLHRDRLKDTIKQRYDTLVKQGVKVITDPERIPAHFIFPDTKKGEEKRDAYIYAAADAATKDMRIMVMSKRGPAPTYFDKHTFATESLTVVEPGGLGYYQWQIDKAFLGKFKNREFLPEDTSEPSALYRWQANEVRRKTPITPQEWKKTIFTSIMKQELKGGVVEYNCESLDAIQVIE